ncbi:autotransporter domain-containing protein, partial [Stenotrophomonas maltophilia]|uniref:autotransporter domain-containing protein n=1 Tax=Stenotrophomonas maltophilia TaxID=40324 RepID=UPI0013DA82CF
YGLGGFGSGKGEAFKVGLYASTRLGDGYLSASAAYGRYALSTNRSVGLTGISGDLTGHFGAHSFAGRIEAGYR